MLRRRDRPRRLARAGDSGRVPSGVWPVLAIGLIFWALAGLQRERLSSGAGNGRYLYPSAVFILLIGSELFRGVRQPLASWQPEW